MIAIAIELMAWIIGSRSGLAKNRTGGNDNVALGATLSYEIGKPGYDLVGEFFLATSD